MTMFSPDTPDINEKLREIEDDEIRDAMNEQGYSFKEIETAVRHAHLIEKIRSLEEILCERVEIIAILSEEGWKREEIEAAMK